MSTESFSMSTIPVMVQDRDTTANPRIFRLVLAALPRRGELLAVGEKTYLILQITHHGTWYTWSPIATIEVEHYLRDNYEPR